MRAGLCLLLLLATPLPAQSLDDRPMAPGAAQRLAVLATVIPVGVGAASFHWGEGGGELSRGVLLMMAGGVLGPASGFWSGGADRRGSLGAVFRFVVGAGTVGAMGAADTQAGTDRALLIGGVVFLGHAAFDLLRVGPVLRRRQQGPAITLNPALWEGPGIGVRVAW